MQSSFHIWQKQYGTTVQYTQIEINDYSVKINILSKKNSVKSVTKKEVLLRKFGTENYHDDVVMICFLIFLNTYFKKFDKIPNFFGAVYIIIAD
jgi:hypothetical protein